MISEFKFSKSKLFYSAVVICPVLAFTAEPTHDRIIAIASPLATVAGILFGFVMASITFISSNSKNQLIANMKSTNLYHPLMENLATTGLALITSCIFMVFSIFMPENDMFSWFLKTSFKLNWDNFFLLIGFYTLIYGLFEFLSTWRKVNDVVCKL